MFAFLFAIVMQKYAYVLKQECYEKVKMLENKKQLSQTLIKPASVVYK